MSSIIRSIKLLLLLCVVVMVTGSGCAETKKARILENTRKDSSSMAPTGKNRYFHSKHYKRSISHSTRKLHRR